jgi:hypothetical protein
MLTVKPRTCFRKGTCSDVSRDIGSSELGISSISSFPPNQGKEVPYSDQDCFLPHSLKCMFHQSSYQRRHKIREKHFRRNRSHKKYLRFWTWGKK